MKKKRDKKRNRALGDTITLFLNSTDPESIKDKLTKKINYALKRKDANKVSILYDKELDRIKNMLNDLLSEITTDRSLANSGTLKKFILLYNENCSPFLFMDDEGNILNKSFYYDKQELPFSNLLIYFIITLLRGDKLNAKYLHKCKKGECGIYFTSKIRSDEISYCPKCSKNNKMTPEDRRIYDENRRKRLNKIKAKDKLTKEGYSWEEATRKIEDEGIKSNQDKD
ncbi:MAG: hypothetical protein AB2L22_09705 [Syntrophales bacterium]